MIIKKFQGKTEEDALNIAKNELGNNIVLMNVRDVKRKGIFGIFMPKSVEVTVALEEEQDKYSTLTPKAVEQTPKTTNIKKDIVEEKQDKVIEERLENLQNLLEKQFQFDDQKQVKQEPVKMKVETDSIETLEKQDSNMKFLKLLYNTMIENEVDEKYTNEFINEIDKNIKPNLPVDFMLSTVYQKMILKFGSANEITPSSKGPKVIFFIGPTGVGKTTTIAKIASKYTVEQKKKVALLTADTYRIAAAEQLRTYANILEIPFKIVYSTEEMKQYALEFASYDYIFVDTAGHSYQNENQCKETKELIDSLQNIMEYETYLVLSATTKYKDLLKIADQYAKITHYSLIFTKLDETVELGNLLNLHLYTKANMSYITCGQNVPDDLEVFNPQKTVKLLLGGKTN